MQTGPSGSSGRHLCQRTPRGTGLWAPSAPYQEGALNLWPGQWGRHPPPADQPHPLPCLPWAPLAAPPPVLAFDPDVSWPAHLRVPGPRLCEACVAMSLSLLLLICLRYRPLPAGSCAGHGEVTFPPCSKLKDPCSRQGQGGCSECALRPVLAILGEPVRLTGQGKPLYVTQTLGGQHQETETPAGSNPRIRMCSFKVSLRWQGYPP